MSLDAEMKRAENARDHLARLLSGRSDFAIDIGRETIPAGADRRLVLRVHVGRSGPQGDLPAEVEGIPVRIVKADYSLE